MPSAATINLPIPKDEYEFEQMTADVLTLKYNTPFRPFGRRGQKQYGIDILSTENPNIVAQCKNYTLTHQDIDKIVTNFEFEFSQNIKEFVIATSMRCDTNLQIYIQNINIQKKYPFMISLIFWEEIEIFIVQDKNLYIKYYGNFENGITTITDLKNHFNENLIKYHIINFLRCDVFVDGISVNLPTEVETFSSEIKNLLYKNLTLQKEPIYKAIMNFCNEIDAFSKYLSTKLFSTSSSQFYRYFPNYKIDEEKHRIEMKQIIKQSLKTLDDLYGSINQGMTMFP